MLVEKVSKVEIEPVVVTDLFEEGNLVKYRYDIYMITDEDTAVKLWDFCCSKHIQGVGMEVDIDDWNKEDVTQYSGTLTLSTEKE